MEKKEIHGYLYILVGSTLWGVSSVVAKSLFNIGLLPAELVFIRLTLATFTLLPILLCFDRKRIIISPKDLPYFFILGFVGVAGMQFTYYYTISKIHVGPAILLQYLQPVWVSVYAFLFQREPLSKAKTVSLFMAMLGCYFVVGGYQFDLLRLNKVGIVSGVAASLFFTFYALYGEKGLRKYNPWTLILYGFGFGAIFYWILISPVKFITGDYSLKMWLASSISPFFPPYFPLASISKGLSGFVRPGQASLPPGSLWSQALPPISCSEKFYILYRF
jgi:drug/metabolite transporter (DMT)-like permease